MHKGLRRKTEPHKSHYRTVKHSLEKGYSRYNIDLFINSLRIPSFALQKKSHEDKSIIEHCCCYFSG